MEPAEFLTSVQGETKRRLGTIAHVLQCTGALSIAGLENTSEIIEYALFSGDGGKRLRPALSLGVARMFSGSCEDTAWQTGLSIELLHTYTLLVDDIQDGDPVRRGVPAAHTRFGPEATILAASRIFAYSLASLYRHSAPWFRELVDTQVHLLHRAQCADIQSRNWESSRRTGEALGSIHAGKTGSLFILASAGGALSWTSPPSPEAVDTLREFGESLGVFYQARNDLARSIDRPETGLTFASVHGNESLKELETLRTQVERALSRVPGDTSLLRELLVLI